MALFRGLRRRLRQMNPCTSCLVVTFLAAVLYLVSAIRGNYFQSSAAAVLAEGHRDALGPGVADRRRLSALPQHRTGSFIVGDDEIQLCEMTSRWALSAIEPQDYIHLSNKSAVSAAASERQHELNPCSVDTLTTLFYIDAGGTLAYNHAAALDGKYEVMMGSCTASKIEWNLDAGYVEKKVSMLTQIDADFVHVNCRIRRESSVDDGGNVDDENRAATTTPTYQRRKRSERGQTTSSLIANMAERRARQIHRDQLRRHFPHFVGTAGLPDPFNHVVADQQTSSPESVKHALPGREHRPRPDERLSGSATHTVQENTATKLTQPVKGRKLNIHSLFRSERDLNQEDRSNVADDASTEIYDQWIAQIHPLNEVIGREGPDVVGKRHSDRLNVLVLALESVSSISFDRHLPKSHRFLVDQPHTVLFTGYNVIGDAAPANIIPLLTGYRDYTLLRVISFMLIVRVGLRRRLHRYE